MTQRATTTWLRDRIMGGPLLVLPGAANALGARIIEEAGFEAAYVSGAGIANTYLAVPDIGLITLSELCAHVAAMRDAVALPLIVDGDTGFGNAVGVAHAVRLLERAGADALQLEDQVFPKKCGHFEGQAIIAADEMVQKIKAAVDARSKDMLIIARTDARAIEGLDAALERGQQYKEAGADVIFIEAPQSREELLSIPTLLPIPQVVNLVEGGKTPLTPLSELGDFRIALFANLTLQASMYAMSTILGELREHGEITQAMREHIAGWSERQRLVRKPVFDALDDLYSVGSGVKR
jgi:2-methylisocitrate lyase-like PEP mutase family enzyme